MAYCKSCGAYIPDGLTACLACGYDESAEHAASAAKKQSSPKEKQNDDLREVMERHRILQQEKNRQWAEKEKERRQKQKDNRRWAEEEYAKRQAERDVEAEQRRKEAEQRRKDAEQRRKEAEQRRKEAEQREAEKKRSSGESGTQADPATVTSTGGNRALAALSYMGVLFALPYFLTPDDAFAKFHAKQGLKLFLFTLATRVLKYFTPFGWIFTLLHLYLIFKGATNALNGKREPLPVIGTIGDK